LGLAQNETFAQLTNRLRRLGGPRGLVALRGIAGRPGAHVEEIAEGLFRRYRNWAERLARTEVMSAYNVQHRDAIEELEAGRVPGEPQYFARWDASPDSRLCPICRDLDRKLAPMGGAFPGGLAHPPAHPSCRGVVVAWSPAWGHVRGEVPRTRDKQDPATEVLRAVAGERWADARRTLSAEIEAQGLVPMQDDQRTKRGEVHVVDQRLGVNGTNWPDGRIEI